MIWILLACQEDVTQIPVECDDRITYATVAEPYLRNYCTGCHATKLPMANRFGAPESVNLDTYADARQWAVRSYVRSVHFQTMPPSGGISDNERRRFKQWALCGAKGSETSTPEFQSEARGTSRLVFALFNATENGYALYRTIEDNEEIAPDNTLTRVEYYGFDGSEAIFEGYEEWSTNGQLVSAVTLEPGLPMGLDNWQDTIDVTVHIEMDGDEWTEQQSWVGMQAYQALWDLDVHERDTSPLLVQWWNEQGEEWGWRMSSDNVLSSAFGTTVSGLHWESQQFSGPQQLRSDLVFPMQDNIDWIDLWLEWRE